MLEVNNLTKKYRKELAVDNISFLLEDGQIGILLGRNGAGKSTTIKSIAGLLRYEGEIFINGMPSKSIEAKKVFSYVPEMPSMFPSLSVIEHMQYIKKAYDLDITDEEIDALLDRFDMFDKKDKLGSELSKGMMQKVSICCALSVKPEVILFDEPMIGLDPAAIKELKKAIIELKENNTTILISTHMLEMVREFWDVVLIMEKGKIAQAYENTKDDASDIEELFFSITEGENN